MILGFKNQFVAPILAGTKVHTLRTGYRWSAGMPIQFYQQVRQPGMRKFRADGVAITVQNVVLQVRDGLIYLDVDGRNLQAEEVSQLLRRDGFSWRDDFLAFFPELGTGAKLTRQLIHWTDLRY